MLSVCLTIFSLKKCDFMLCIQVPLSIYAKHIANQKFPKGKTGPNLILKFYVLIKKKKNMYYVYYSKYFSKTRNWTLAMLKPKLNYRVALLNTSTKQNFNCHTGSQCGQTLIVRTSKL